MTAIMPTHKHNLLVIMTSYQDIDVASDLYTGAHAVTITQSYYNSTSRWMVGQVSTQWFATEWIEEANCASSCAGLALRDDNSSIIT